MSVELKYGLLVRHPERPEWGVGEVRSFEAGKVVVLFSKVGRKVLRVDIASEKLVATPPEERAGVTFREDWEKTLEAKSRGIDPESGHYRRRTHCFLCSALLDSKVHHKCESCGWLLCRCGACGCRHEEAPSY